MSGRRSQPRFKLKKKAKKKNGPGEKKKTTRRKKWGKTKGLDRVDTKALKEREKNAAGG